mgnify:CR=1 FL=1
MSQDRVTSRAEALFEQHRLRQSFAPFVGDDTVDSIDTAYAIQAVLVERLLTDRSETVAGYKIGLTSPRMQALLGIDSPIAGVVFGGRVHASGVQVSRADFGQLGIECEIVVRIGQDLLPAAAPYTSADVAAAVEAVCPAFELVDDRAADYTVTDISSLVADNSWNAGLVLGEFREQWPDLASLVGVVSRNGTELDRGDAADVLGHPFNALLWLANHLARGERGLRRGDLVATGSIVPTRVPSEPETCVFSLDGLGEVVLEVVD